MTQAALYSTIQSVGGVRDGSPSIQAHYEGPSDTAVNTLIREIPIKPFFMAVSVLW